MEFRCPSCHALIYSRRPKLCGQCGALLPAELLLSDEQAKARADGRRWARELAEKFSARQAAGATFAAPSDAASRLSESQDEFLATKLLREVSCAAEFRHRKRPAFWVYVAGYAVMFLTSVFLRVELHVLSPAALLLLLGALALPCLRAWHTASPICPRCKQNIRFCGADFCHVCGQPLKHRRCPACEGEGILDRLFTPHFRMIRYRRVAYCPGCGVHLDTKVLRWQSGRSAF
jgi:predicted amidophosphoribosyltransferase